MRPNILPHEKPNSRTFQSLASDDEYESSSTHNVVAQKEEEEEQEEQEEQEQEEQEQEQEEEEELGLELELERIPHSHKSIINNNNNNNNNGFEILSANDIDDDNNDNLLENSITMISSTINKNNIIIEDTMSSPKSDSIQIQEKSSLFNKDININSSPEIFPWGTYIGGLSAVFSVYFAMSVIFPFAPFMVQSFYPNQSKENLGYYVGYLDSAFFTGSLLASITWGKLSDRWGRKPILLIGIMGSAITSVLFGFSVSFSMAIIVRFIWGALDGNVGVMKTVMGEVSTPSTQARMYSIFGITGGVGFLFGNFAGGWLSHIIINEDTKNFPFLLPCLVNGTSFVIAFICVTCLLKETLRPPNPNAPKKVSPNTLSVIRQRNVYISTSFYGLTCFLSAGLQAVFPLWVLEDKSHHGFGWREKEIGTIFAIVGPCFALAQLFLFPICVKKFGYIKLAKVLALIHAIAIILLPHLSVFRHQDTIIPFILILLLMIIAVTARTMAFTCSYVMINNSGESGIRATANGIGQMFGSIARLGAPMLLCNIYAICVDRNLPWPFDYRFVFYLQGFIGIASVLWLYCLPNNFEERCANVNVQPSTSNNTK